MSIIALARRMHRMDRGRTNWVRHVEQLTDAELQAAIEDEVRKTDPALADRLRSASEEERVQLHKQMAAGALP